MNANQTGRDSSNPDPYLYPLSYHHAWMEMAHVTTEAGSTSTVNATGTFYLDQTTIETNLVTSVLTVLTNVYGLAACVSASEKKWHPTFALHKTLFLIYALYGAGSLVNSVRKLFTVQLFQVTTADRLRCCTWYMVAIFTQSAMVDLHLLLAIDRLLAFCFPLWYRFQYKPNVLYGQLFVVLLHAVCAVLMRYVTIQENEVRVCIIFNVGSSTVIELTFYGYYITLLLALVVNLLLVILIKRKCTTNSSSSAGSDRAGQTTTKHRQRELKVITTLALCVVAQIITLAISQILKHLAVHQSDLHRKIVITSWSNILDLSGLANFLVISLKNSELQKLLIRPLRSLPHCSCRLKRSFRFAPYASNPNAPCAHERVPLHTRDATVI